MTRVLAAFLAVATLAARPAVPASADDQRPAALKQVAIDQRLNEQVPLGLAFRDEDGRQVTLGDYFGKRPVILTLAYYECPMLCTLVLNGLTKSLKTMSFDPGDEFEIVTVSFDPRDTPATARAKKDTYVKEYGREGAAEGWHFLTGDEASIHALTEAVGYHYNWVPGENQFAHAAAIMVLTPDGKLARYFYGVEYAPRDLRLGLVEAGRGEIGSPIDQLLLYCYHYDPMTGTYGAVAMNLVRAGGALTVLALGVFIAVMRRREHALGTQGRSA